LAILALSISLVLWTMAHGASDIEQGFDIQVAFHGISDKIVITDQSADEINVRVLGGRAALRSIKVSDLEYRVQVEGGKPGPAIYEVDTSRIEAQLPRGTRIVSRSPSQISVRFERRGRKSVRVRADLEGEPAEGYQVAGIEIEPPRVWLVGARSAVLRLSEVVTETVDVAGIAESTEREVRLSLGDSHVWREDDDPVTLKIAVEPRAPDEDEAAKPNAKAPTGAKRG
jgi:YbbR domain-containing protein